MTTLLLLWLAIGFNVNLLVLSLVLAGSFDLRRCSSARNGAVLAGIWLLAALLWPAGAILIYAWRMDRRQTYGTETK